MHAFQTGPLLVIGHQAILRVLYGYLTGMNKALECVYKSHTSSGKIPQECPTLEMPLHTIIQLTPRAYTCDEVWHKPMV
jgi:broad specificity phosphatase PhoE